MVGTRVGVMIGGHKVGVKVWLSKSGVKVNGSGGRGSRSGAGVKVRERWVKVGGGVRWLAGFSGGEVGDK